MNKNVRKKLFRYLKLIIKIVIAGVALYYVYTKIDITALIDNFRKANILYLMAALLLFAFSKLVAAHRLNHYFSSIKIYITHYSNIKLYLLGMFYNFFLPGGIGGDGYKIYLLNKQSSVKTKKIFWAVFLDRINGLLALFCLAVLMSYFIYYPIEYKYFFWLLIPLAIGVSYIIIAYFFTDYKFVFKKTLILSFLVQISQTISAFLILLALGIYNSTFEYLVVFLVSSIVAALPISIGGIGSREFTFLMGANFLNLNINSSVALSLIFYIITAIVSLFGVYYSLYSENLKNLTTKTQ